MTGFITLNSNGVAAADAVAEEIPDDTPERYRLWTTFVTLNAINRIVD